MSRSYKTEWVETTEWTAVPPEFKEVFKGSDTVPYPFIWVCPICGRTGQCRYKLGDSSCVTWAELCWDITNKNILNFNRNNIIRSVLLYQKQGDYALHCLMGEDHPGW